MSTHVTVLSNLHTAGSTSKAPSWPYLAAFVEGKQVGVKADHAVCPLTCPSLRASYCLANQLGRVLLAPSPDASGAVKFEGLTNCLASAMAEQ
jgi:hypothetical protein